MVVRNALIAGATGLLGSELVSLLIENNYYTSIHLITRRPYHLKHRKIADHIIDFNKLDEFSLNAQVHDVFICLGTTIKKAGSQANFLKVDLEFVDGVAKWAKQHNAEKLAFISSVGANAESNNFYLSVKGKAENALKNIDFKNLILIRPSLLLGKRNESRIVEKIGKNIFTLLNPLFIGKLKRYKAIQAKLVAKAMFYFTVHAESKISVIENEKIFDIAELSF
jgi:uncharacterized protein YbjT (DUF2867 family)